MESFFDIEQSINKVKSVKTQKYLREVLSTYNNREYRSCIVMLYATTFIDVLDKIKTMADVYQNIKAEKFLEDFDNNRKSNKAYSSLERDVKSFIIECGFINEVEEKQWNHLKDYRDYCAHPVVGNDYELISPNGEQVRMHIRNMFEAIFLKDALVADKSLFDEFLKKIESFYDRNELDGLEEYVNTRYISRLDLKTKGRFIKNLWKISFYISDEECNKYRRIAYRVLEWIIKSDKNNTLDFINSNISFFDGKIDYQDIEINNDDKDFIIYDNKSLSLLMFLYRVPEVYKILSEDNQTEIKSISKKNINLLLMSYFLYDSCDEHIQALINYLDGLNDCFIPALIRQLCKNNYNKFNYKYNDVIIYYFFNCLNSSEWSPDYNIINWTYNDILEFAIPYFTLNQVDEFLQKLNTSYIKASSFKSLATKIYDVVNEKEYDIDFTKYTINILKYINK